MQMWLVGLALMVGKERTGLSEATALPRR